MSRGSAINVLRNSWLGTVLSELEDGHDIVLATEEQIIDATRLVWERMKIVVEPSCALTLASIMANKEKFTGQKVVLIITGGNVDLVSLPWQKVGKE